MNKKILAVLMALVMMCVCVAVVSAADEATITVASPSGVQGGKVSVTISVANNPGMWGATLNVTYGEGLTLTDVQDGTVFAGVTMQDPFESTNAVKLGWMTMDSSYTTTNNGILATLKFDVAADATRDNVFVNASYTAGDIVNSANSNVDFTITNGKVLFPRENYNITINSVNAVYDGTAKYLTVSGADAYGITPTVTNNGGHTDVGTYTVTVTSPATDAYNALNISGKITITPASLTAVASGNTVVLDGTVYNGDDVTIDVSSLKIVKDGDDWVASSFVLAGAKSGNYEISNSSVIITPEAGDIVTATVTSEFEEGTPTTTFTEEFFKGQDSKITAPAVSGYSFVGWYNGETLVSSDKDYTFTAASDFAITAKYKKGSNITLIAAIAASNKKSTVQFNTLGANIIAPQTVKRGELVKEPAAPTKTGYVFGGWYTDMNCTNKFDFTRTVSEDMMLFAKWYADNRIIMTIGAKDAIVAGKTVTNDVAPIILNERTMLPARFVAENLGATIAWDAAARKVTVKGANVTIELTIDSDTAYVNGAAVKLDSPAVIISDRTYTPVRFVAETLGAEVEWDGVLSQVTITK